MFALISAVVSCVLLSSPSAVESASAPEPAFNFETVLDTYFDDESGLISFQDYLIAFAPEGPLNAQVAVVNSENTIVQSFKFFEGFKFREGVWAKASVVGPADVSLTEPGVYNIVFLVEGKPVTRLGFVLEREEAGDDPFNPEVKYHFDGLWRAYGYIGLRKNSDDEMRPEFVFWRGGKDLPEGKTKDMFGVSIYRDGELVAHSKEDLGFMTDGHFERTAITLFRPHERKAAANAELFEWSEWTQDGSYEVRVNRRSDDTLIRSFKYTAAGGKIEPLAQTAMSFEPHIDYMMPKVQKKNTSGFEVIDAVWLISK